MDAVITADIIGYTKLTNSDADNVLNTIHSLFSELTLDRNNLSSNFSIKRGDSIQGEISNPADALKIALLLKTAVKKLKVDSKNLDIRIAIGVGNIDNKRNSIDESFGEAYIYSGRSLDNMKNDRRVFVAKTNNTVIDEELDVELILLEAIMSGWKTTSAEVLYYTLLGFNETEIAERLNVSQSAINQRKKTAGWVAVEALVNRYEKLIKTIS